MSDGREGGFQYRLALLEVEDKEILANTCAQESVLYAIHGTGGHELAEVIGDTAPTLPLRLDGSQQARRMPVHLGCHMRILR